MHTFLLVVVIVLLVALLGAGEWWRAQLRYRARLAREERARERLPPQGPSVRVRLVIAAAVAVLLILGAVFFPNCGL